jgi:Calx-beta domain
MHLAGQLQRGALILLASLALGACGGSGASTESTSSPPPAANAGTLSFSTATASVSQPATSVTLTVMRSGGSSGAASLQYAAVDGTAASGSNYIASSGTLSWADGDSSSKSVMVALSTAAFVGAKNFTLSLSGASGAVLGSPASAVVTISGNGTATPQDDVEFSATGYAVAQSAGSIMVTVNRVAGSSGAASVSYATSDGTAVAGTNYTAASGILTWNDGDGSAKGFTVAISATPFSGTKTFTVTLSKPSGGFATRVALKSRRSLPTARVPWE